MIFLHYFPFNKRLETLISPQRKHRTSCNQPFVNDYTISLASSQCYVLIGQQHEASCRLPPARLLNINTKHSQNQRHDVLQYLPLKMQKARCLWINNRPLLQNKIQKSSCWTFRPNLAMTKGSGKHDREWSVKRACCIVTGGQLTMPVTV